MKINLAKIERHVDLKLQRVAQVGQADGLAGRLGAIRKFMGIETNRLHLRHRHGIDGPQIVAARSLIVDRLIQHLAETAIRENAGSMKGVDSLAIVALGGYGRGELSPLSDIDLLFLYPEKSDLGLMTKLNEALLYLLWDIGFTVGHSVRSMSECLSMAQEDAVSRHSLIDARLVWGSEDLVKTLGERLNREVFEKSRSVCLAQLLRDREDRYRSFGGVVCLQEPNLKESAGGLRDLQTLCWAGRIADPERPPFSDRAPHRCPFARFAAAGCAPFRICGHGGAAGIRALHAGLLFAGAPVTRAGDGLPAAAGAASRKEALVSACTDGAGDWRVRHA